MAYSLPKLLRCRFLFRFSSFLVLFANMTNKQKSKGIIIKNIEFFIWWKCRSVLKCVGSKNAHMHDAWNFFLFCSYTKIWMGNDVDENKQKRWKNGKEIRSKDKNKEAKTKNPWNWHKKGCRSQQKHHSTQHTTHQTK